jgi:hypothetical protein
LANCREIGDQHGETIDAIELGAVARRRET